MAIPATPVVRMAGQSSGGGQADNRVGAEEGAGVGYGQVVLTDVHAVNAHAASPQREGDINTVVDEERLVRLDDAGDSFGELVELARADGFGPDLDAGGVCRCFLRNSLIEFLWLG